MGADTAEWLVFQAPKMWSIRICALVPYRICSWGMQDEDQL